VNKGVDAPEHRGRSTTSSRVRESLVSFRNSRCFNEGRGSCQSRRRFRQDSRFRSSDDYDAMREAADLKNSATGENERSRRYHRDRLPIHYNARGWSNIFLYGVLVTSARIGRKSASGGFHPAVRPTSRAVHLPITCNANTMARVAERIPLLATQTKTQTLLRLIKTMNVSSH